MKIYPMQGSMYLDLLDVWLKRSDSTVRSQRNLTSHAGKAGGTYEVKKIGGVTGRKLDGFSFGDKNRA